MKIPDGLLFTKEHEWVKIENNRAVMGISDYAQGSLGDITFVELPKSGSSCKQFSQIATVESVKAASDVYAPLSGKITAVNEKIVSNPEIVNQSPYDQGWFVKIELSDVNEKSNLLTSAEYKKYVEGL